MALFTFFFFELSNFLIFSILKVYDQFGVRSHRVKFYIAVRQKYFISNFFVWFQLSQKTQNTTITVNRINSRILVTPASATCDYLKFNWFVLFLFFVIGQRFYFGFTTLIGKSLWRFYNFFNRVRQFSRLCCESAQKVRELLRDFADRGSSDMRRCRETKHVLWLIQQKHQLQS